MAGKKRNRTAFTIGTLAIIVIAGIGIAGAFAVGQSIVSRNSELLLREPVSYSELMDSLTAGDARITNADRFSQFALIMKMGDTVKPGRYLLREGMTARQAVGMFRSGNQSPVNVTFNNVRTMEDLAGKLASQLRADSLEFLSVLKSDSMAAFHGFGEEEFIGMFIPNTYQLYWTISPVAFADRMKREYHVFWKGDREKKLERTGLTAKEASVLASIVEEETNKPDEMPAVAGVYINRLRKNMLLQADPTVKFAAGDPTAKRIWNKDLEIDSPYNTYKYKGLPPGPIRMPSVQAIDAVLNYQQHDYLYLCAKSDFSGYHAFAKTLEEHNRNAQQYRKALDRAGIR